jgi:hypothetical protein
MATLLPDFSIYCSSYSVLLLQELNDCCRGERHVHSPLCQKFSSLGQNQMPAEEVRSKLYDDDINYSSI